ncbi:threonine dehydratase [Iningainema tapete]|uniref:Threonine dehydratase n=1 Tax=Iningainema tapete BLCC-T55 TaxID=2748662 RepID=A0A8J6XL85_9CYAN|nr:threonine dehydratase [Iningainema tapete]MBD2773689.1 threonine dehydratase [Iningainema tapete BLCC-T55]
MSRLNQIIQNSFLRLQGFFSVIFRQISSFFGNVFGLFAKLFGFSTSEYYLESEQAQTIKRAQAQLNETESVNPEVSTTTRRRPKIKTDDYYLNMAKDVKKG